ncbi:MAG: hypothetical protein H6644_05605 [Caldilineaceae bacterium]|nr:hypothetical protein [Caldilineaceae bacterium]
MLIATSGYVWWLGGTLLLAAGAVLVTVWAAPPAAQWLVRRSLNMRKAAGSGVLALVLTSLPVAFVPLLWVDDRLRLVPAWVNWRCCTSSPRSASAWALPPWPRPVCNWTVAA